MLNKIIYLIIIVLSVSLVAALQQNNTQFIDEWYFSSIGDTQNTVSFSTSYGDSQDFIGENITTNLKDQSGIFYLIYSISNATVSNVTTPTIPPATGGSNNDPCRLEALPEILYLKENQDYYVSLNNQFNWKWTITASSTTDAITLDKQNIILQPRQGEKIKVTTSDFNNSNRDEFYQIDFTYDNMCVKSVGLILDNPKLIAKTNWYQKLYLYFKLYYRPEYLVVLAFITIIIIFLLHKEEEKKDDKK